jgi:hypothetical protein
VADVDLVLGCKPRCEQKRGVMPTTICFRGREDGITVDGRAQDVADQLGHDGPVRLNTISGSVIFVNWANVLYVEEESYGPAAVQSTTPPQPYD